MWKTAILLLIFTTVLILPSPVLASDASVSINILRGDDGTIAGELWYNGHIMWRVMLAADGATPVSGGNNSNTTVLVPDIVNGMFQIKIFNQ